jgi:hypothetical protein
MNGQLAVVTVTSAAVLAAGCGAASTEDDAVARAVEETTATSARVSVRGLYDFGQVREEFTGKGVYDWEGKIGRFETQYQLGGPGGGPAAVEAIITRDASYMAYPFLSRYGKRWLKAPTPESNDESPLAWFGGLGSVPGDPAAMLRFLHETSEKVDLVDRETVRGVETTHYRAHLDWDRLTRDADPGIEETLVENMKAESDGKPVTVDLWVDRDDLARRVRTALPPAGTPLQLTIDFFDFGVPVEVEPPPADEVMTTEELQKRAGEECNVDEPNSDDEGVSLCVELDASIETEGEEGE